MILDVLGVPLERKMRQIKFKHGEVFPKSYKERSYKIAPLNLPSLWQFSF